MLKKITTTIPHQIYQEIKHKRYNISNLIILGFELLEGKFKVLDQLKRIEKLERNVSEWQNFLKRSIIDINKEIIALKQRVEQLEKNK